jgi:Zn-dependent peptidase ImmA (M78 family)
MLSENRKQELSELGEFIANSYCPNNIVSPEIIADQYGITYSYGNYNDDFDGLLEHQSGKFHIYINLDRLQNPYKPRARFTFAHELGHYFIDEHRNALRSGQAPAHSSFTNFSSENIVEKEADFFASCLLMPSERFKEATFRKKFNFQLADTLAAKFQTSITSTLLRFITLNIYPITVIRSKNNIIKWRWFTRDFPYYKLKWGKHKLPEDTVAGEFFNKKITRKHTETVYADDWFDVYDKQYEREFYEHCIYWKNQNTVISVIWED